MLSKMSLMIYFVISLGFSMLAHGASNTRVVTNYSQLDGFGSQFLHVIATVMFAQMHGMKFVYTPFTTMEHNYDNDPDFIAKKERLINFIDNFEVNTDATTFKPPHISRFWCYQANLSAFEHSVTSKKIKEVFRANKTIDKHFNNERFNIAVHVRRPNSHDNRIEGADTPDVFFLTVINKLRQLHGDKAPLFHIYSQGVSRNFALYEGVDVVLHLNESIEDSFIAMVAADALVTSPSAFSYCAALLSKGIVYYIPFASVPISSWISINQLLAP